MHHASVALAEQPGNYLLAALSVSVTSRRLGCDAGA